jgi:predicted acylesterase/phospholipase RssA
VVRNFSTCVLISYSFILGGGLKGYFVCGCVAVLQHQLQQHNLEVGRVAGASAGAWSALFICTGISTSLWIESYHKLLENPDKTIHEIYVEEMVYFSGDSL